MGWILTIYRMSETKILSDTSIAKDDIQKLRKVLKTDISLEEKGI